MKAILVLLATAWTATLSSATFDYDAPPDVGRNKKYFNFIKTDEIHASCYYSFCHCGNKEYSGHQSTIHEMSCDTHRTGLSDKNVYKCTTNPDCEKKIGDVFGGLFLKLFPLIKRHKLDTKACKFYQSVCYGMLLKDAVVLYRDNTKLSYFLQDVLG